MPPNRELEEFTEKQKAALEREREDFCGFGEDGPTEGGRHPVDSRG